MAGKRRVTPWRRGQREQAKEARREREQMKNMRSEQKAMEKQLAELYKKYLACVRKEASASRATVQAQIRYEKLRLKILGGEKGSR